MTKKNKTNQLKETLIEKIFCDKEKVSPNNYEKRPRACRTDIMEFVEQAMQYIYLMK